MNNTHQNMDTAGLNDLTLAFVGKITAIFSHELKNHLSVIRESNGLMQDMIDMASGRKLKTEQHTEAIRSIDRQIDRTLSLLAPFDRFSARLAWDGSPYRISEIVDDLVALIRRLLSQRRISIEKRLSGDAVCATCAPVILIFVIFSLMEGLMDMAEDEGTILIELSSEDNKSNIRLTLRSPLISVEKRSEVPIDALQRIAESIGFFSFDSGKTEMILSIQRDRG